MKTVIVDCSLGLCVVGFHVVYVSDCVFVCMCVYVCVHACNCVCAYLQCEPGRARVHRTCPPHTVLHYNSQ
jgi:hypothetical protein